MFEKSSTPRNSEAITKRLKPKSVKRKIVEEYDIGSDGDELLAKEVGKPNSKRNPKPERASKSKNHPPIKKPASSVKKKHNNFSTQYTERSSQDKGLVSPRAVSNSKSQTKFYKTQSSAGNSHVQNPTTFKTHHQDLPTEKLKNSTSRLSKLFFEKEPTPQIHSTNTKLNVRPINQPYYKLRSDRSRTPIQQLKDPPKSLASSLPINSSTKRKKSADPYTQRHLFYRASTFTTGNGILKH